MVFVFGLPDASLSGVVFAPRNVISSVRFPSDNQWPRHPHLNANYFFASFFVSRSEARYLQPLN
jgi:hypothetical protein